MVAVLMREQESIIQRKLITFNTNQNTRLCLTPTSCMILFVSLYIASLHVHDIRSS